MNKHKITSIVLISAMLTESLPIVNAYDSTSLDNTIITSENNDTQYNADIEQDSNVDISDNNTINDNNNVSNNNNDNIENTENPTESTLEDLDSEDSSPDFNDNDESNSENLSTPSLEDTEVDNNFIIENLESKANQDNELNEEIISKNIEDLDINIINDSVGSVLEITLADGEFVPDLTGNPGGYDTIRVTTTGSKKLVATDYNNLRESLIPNIDLSQAISDSIPANAFKNATHLKIFKFPYGIKSIGNDAFWNCKGFNGNLVIPDSVTSIGSCAFTDCKGFTGNLIIPNSVTSIGEFAFYLCSGFTGNLIIPNSVTSIGNSAFNGCSGFTGNLIIPDSVTSIGNDTFLNCSGFTGDLIIPNSVTTIGSYAFNGCSGFTGDLIIPNSVTSIGSYAFSGCSGFTGDLIIPNSVTSIGISTFYGCGGFTGDLIIPDSVETIGTNVFRNCLNINNFIFRINESFADSNYRKDIFDKLDVNKTIVEMSYNFDTSGTWLDTLDSKNNGKPVLKSETPMTDGKSSLISLYIPTPCKEENISILKDGEFHDLPTKIGDGKYLFDEEGSYSVTLTTDLGSTSNIDFEVVASINKPDINYENNLVSIIDNGNNLGLTTDRIEYRINGGEWNAYSGEFRIPDEFVNGIDLITIEARTVVGNDVSTVANIDLSVSIAEIIANDIEIVQGDSFNELDCATAIDIDGADISNKITVVSSNVKLDTPGEYTITYQVEASNGYFTKKEIKVTVLKKKLPPIIIAEDVVLEKGEEFDPLDFIVVTDSDGNYLDKSNVEIIENTVNLSEPGKYKISYKMVDNNGLSTTKTITVTVEEPDVDNDNSNENSNENSGNSISDNNKNNNGEANKNKIPNTGGVAPLLNLANIISFIGGYLFINKRNKR